MEEQLCDVCGKSVNAIDADPASDGRAIVLTSGRTIYRHDNCHHLHKPGVPEVVTTDGSPPCENTDLLVEGAPCPVDPATGQHKSYWVLSEEERRKGFVRPVRRTYVHSKCHTETSMGIAIAETYAANPKFYGSTFCCFCRTHFPVGEFKWKGTDELVGS